MSSSLCKRLGLLPIGAMLSASIATAQDTLWVRANAPTPKETYAVSFSADGSKVFSGSECSPAYLRIFNTTDGSQLWHYELGNTLLCVQGVKLSSNGTKAAAMEEMGNLLIFDYTGPSPILTNTVTTGTSGAFALDFSPDNTRIVTACTDKKMNIYRVSDGMQLHTALAHTAWVLSVDWSPAGNYIVTGGNDNLVKIWDSTGAAVRTLSGHTGAVQSVRFSADGNYIVSGAKDDKVKIWETATGNLVRTISGHTGDVMQVDVSDDGTKIVSGSTDSTIRIWNFSTGAQIMSFRKPGRGTIYSVDFAPNGNYVAAGTSTGDVQLWDITKTTAVDDVSVYQNTLLVFPNPAANSVTVSSNDGVISLVSVIDISGKTIITRQINAKEKSLDISSLPAGHYEIVAVFKSGNTARVKVIKQ